MYIHTHTHTSCAHTHTDAYEHTHTHVHTCICTHADTQTHTNTCTYTHIHRHVHIHCACTHARTPSHCPSLYSHLHSLTSPNFMFPSPLYPSLTSEHVLSSLTTHSLCTVSWHSVREEGEGRWEEGKQRKEEGGIKIRKKRERRKKEGRGWEEEKGRGEEWRMEWLTSACKAIFPWKDGFSAPITFGTTKTNFMPLKLMA